MGVIDGKPDYPQLGARNWLLNVLEGHSAKNRIFDRLKIIDNPSIWTFICRLYERSLALAQKVNAAFGLRGPNYLTAFRFERTPIKHFAEQI
ncbi:hypothetical protein [Sphingobium sp.]|uniref:hypothetical protein n=1 Tax=Sphingobium sp. TaxID=1912891 RepID=UPI0035C7783F